MIPGSARATAAALSATATELGNRNSALRARSARLRSQLRAYESAAQTAAVQWAKAEAVSQTLLRCTDLVRKAVVGSRSAGAARDVCRAAAKRIQAYEAG